MAGTVKPTAVQVTDADDGGARPSSEDRGGEIGLTVAEAAQALGLHRTRVYALLNSGDLVAARASEATDEGDAPLRVDRSSVERWQVAGGARGGPLTARNAWAVIGLASGDQPFAERCLGLLEHPEELSRTRSRLSNQGFSELAPRLRRRATVVVRNLPRRLLQALEQDAVVVRTGASAAGAYGWTELRGQQAWTLDAYLPLRKFSEVQEQLNRALLDEVEDDGPGEQVLLRAVDESWPFPPHYLLAPQPLAALDLLEYPDPIARRIGREVLESLGQTSPSVLARRTARARAASPPLLLRKLDELREQRAPRPVVEGDPRTDTRAAAAHLVGVLWASASHGVSIKELRAAIGLSRERFETAYEYLLEQPPLGLSVQRHGEELWLVTAPEVSVSVERHLEKPRETGLSKAALEVLAIVAYRQPIARSGIELIRASGSTSAVDTLLDRGLIQRNAHQLFVTTQSFLEFMSLRDLADLPALGVGSDDAELGTRARLLGV